MMIAKLAAKEKVHYFSDHYDCATSLPLFTFMHWRRKWQPTPVFLPGESQGRGSLVGRRLWGRRVGHNWSDLAAAAAAWHHLTCWLEKDCQGPSLSSTTSWVIEQVIQTFWTSISPSVKQRQKQYLYLIGLF